MRSTGVAATAIDGSYDYNGWSQIEEAGYVNSELIITPGAFVAHTPRTGPCRMQDERLLPAVKPVYALSFDPEACGGPANFPAVPYHGWLSPHHASIYIVRDTLPEH